MPTPRKRSLSQGCRAAEVSHREVLERARAAWLSQQSRIVSARIPVRCRRDSALDAQHYAVLRAEEAAARAVVGESESDRIAAELAFRIAAELALRIDAEVERVFFVGGGGGGGNDLPSLAVTTCTFMQFVSPPIDTRAERKASALLKDWLSPEQRKNYDRENAFEVIGSKTGKRYRICHGGAYNVSELDAVTGQVADVLCFAPSLPTAVSDVMLAQKIALENDEEGVLRVANSRNRTALTAGYFYNDGGLLTRPLPEGIAPAPGTPDPPGQPSRPEPDRPPVPISSDSSSRIASSLQRAANAARTWLRHASTTRS